MKKKKIAKSVGKNVQGNSDSGNSKKQEGGFSTNVNGTETVHQVSERKYSN